MKFHDFTMLALGTRRSHRVHDAATLVPAAVEVFSGLLSRGRTFREPLPVAEFAHVELHWTDEGAAGAAATFYARGHVLTHSVLLAGDDPARERGHLQETQKVLYGTWRGTATEPGIDLLSITERSCIISIPFPFPPGIGLEGDMEVISDCETCLMAAWLLKKAPS